MKKLRSRFPLKRTRVNMVLDNARAHVTVEAKALATQLNIELLYMPPYSPEFNCIEALWSVLKRDFKRRVLEMRQIVIGDALFRQLLQDSLDAIKPKVQQKAARYNNRGFMHLVLGKLVQKEADFVEHQLPAISETNSSDEWDSVDEEIKQVEDEAVRSELAREPSAEIPPSV